MRTTIPEKISEPPTTGPVMFPLQVQGISLFRWVSMRIIPSIVIACLVSTLLSGCSQPHATPAVSGSRSLDSNETLISASSPVFSNVVAVANEFVVRAGRKWGEPVEVRWQGNPLNRYVVFYATPEHEMVVGGPRGVHVGTNGAVWFVPQG